MPAPFATWQMPFKQLKTAPTPLWIFRTSLFPPLLKFFYLSRSSWTLNSVFWSISHPFQLASCRNVKDFPLFLLPNHLQRWLLVRHSMDTSPSNCYKSTSQSLCESYSLYRKNIIGDLVGGLAEIKTYYVQTFLWSTKFVDSYFRKRKKGLGWHGLCLTNPCWFLAVVLSPVFYFIICSWFLLAIVASL